MIYEGFTPYDSHPEYNGGYFCTADVFEQIKTLEEAGWNALSALRAGDNPPQMTELEFIQNTRRVAIGILKKGLEIE